MFNSIGPLELLIVFTIVLMVFGSDKLPELARGLGKGIREIRRAANMVRNEILSETDMKIENPLQDEINEIKGALDSEPVLDPNLSGNTSGFEHEAEQNSEPSMHPDSEEEKTPAPKNKKRKTQSNSKN
jgi:TatA/E family protein of Tat protein translocase